jgi:PAS domain S-box-containing protein
MAGLPELYADPRLDAEYRTWAACTGSMLTRHRIDGTFCYASAACRAILGWEPDEIVGKKLAALLHPDDARMMVSELGKVPAHSRPVTMTFRLLKKDGTYVWVEATAGVIENTEAGAPEIITILRDVSDRASVDNQVRRAQEILPSLFDRLPVVIVFLDKDGQVQYVNRYCETLFGWSLAELREPESWRRMYAERGPRERVQGWAKDPAPEIVDVRTLTKSGGSRVIRWAGVKLSDDSSIGMGIDITARLAVEEALRESESRARSLNEQLVATDRRKDEFLAILAHELRNPLAPIANTIDALIRKKTDDPDITRARRLIHEKVQHLVRLVDDLLDVSRISNGIIRLDLTTCEISDVLQQALTTSQPLLDRAGHSCALDVGAGPVWLRGDRVRLVQVFSNLLNNAAKFTLPGGDISISATHSGGFAVVRVRDNGQGIATEELPHIFDLFYRSQHPPGTAGIGLSLVRSIVELHGGSVEARSEGPGKGSEFIVRLPALAKQERVADSFYSSATVNESTPPPRRVLVVDDDLAVADGFAMLLESMGQEVVVVHDGASAVDATVRFDPSIVFIDLGMPGIDGYETARRIRKLPGSESRRLIALTGYGLTTVESRISEAGFDRYLAKPARPEDLDRIFA